MSKDKFNPADWLPSKETSTAEPHTEKASVNPGSLHDDIETVTQRIESAATDITAGYANWRDLGFALAEALGESGRGIYHRISRFNPDYKPEETDKQYSRCLSAHGSGITVRTFFHAAKDHGIDISSVKCAKYADYAKYAQSADCAYSQNTATAAQSGNIDNIGNIGDIDEDLPLPTFSPQLAGNLPSFLEKVTAFSNSPEDADILTLGTMAVVSACLPHIWGIYADRAVYPNLFLFVTAKASSGKGRLSLCRHIVEPIHERLREINEAETMDYKHRLAEYNAAGKKKVNLEKPEEPPMRMLFIPANSSATAVYQVLGDNDGQGLMFETEGDTLANTFGSDYGNYSDGFRKAFHHETISYIRRKDREYVNIRNPRLSTLLTGTPRQVLNLITDAENGLFSRFIFYVLNLRLVWNDVFRRSSDTTLDEYFQALGKEFNDFHTILSGCPDIRFRLTEDQAADFNSKFDSWQSAYSDSCGDEFVASVRRLGLVTFRIAMILSSLRILEDGDFSTELLCLDTDYQSAMVIAEVILQHNAHIFLTLPKAAAQGNAASSGSSAANAHRTTLQHQQFLEALPAEFDRKIYSDTATTLSISPRTADRIIRRWCASGQLTNIAHGKYRKKE